ncbi:hypothetical protein Kpol_1058p17 [Vanderwaltozyma polyspora DSM 70294]|uniref:25S rRNA (Uridine(2843)-N(3))-methyltransferase n=1 Tax=Vanderwaltozyma polyspora (strain ATCC 22028 / DSM 70294 / BCRC 21397 / CBS 2163 / NBRC 10782 / NRRL Y-8283 / UCD 57-17) TaxID=436907 RepID=A7TJQ1_VANPO|nr:uncharacterized protein Kpol_1058p17 [Vanderwaltozyma polyspora DSM 70294]EDO17480.1 hypothetical protein Kpol_1058p17 [Vanderwaltozyma polyspora DSM 70294]
MASKSSQQLPVHDKNSLPPQEIVDLFKTTFNDELYLQDIETLMQDIQSVKTDLYNREYIEAFSNDIKRVAYCCRWTPSRATAYASLFTHFKEIVQLLTCANGDQSVLCIGGGAGSEMVAMSSIFTPTRKFASKYAKDVDESKDQDGKHSLHLHVVDIADWSNVLDRLTKEIADRWLYSGEIKYFDIKFTKDDVLQMKTSQLHLSELNLITLMFTTNELFTEHKTDSIRLLQKFNKECKTGCYLLIVESAGSYSHIMVGSKKFPIQFLIDTILVGKRGEEANGAWELVNQNDSIWYRGDLNIDYPMKLENMRFFYRLYRKN